ncbi:HAD family hydrolase [Vulcanisaeta thermophila]|uniref:HAD family hydrolase n=1 Tax=Vulcanisaeta thermophila TaxID=867917 RepID=UPI0008533367|nr:HAD-IB family phosphatase [Vulcanisaeta thermophila]
MITTAILDVDGVLTYFKSAWQHLHRILGTEYWASINREAYKAGLINYRDWAITDALLWFGVPKTWAEPPITLRRGAIELLRTLKAANMRIIAITGGLNYTGAPIRDYVNHYISNELIYDESGNLISVRVNVESKEVINEILNQLGIDWNEVLAIGDSEMDIPMLTKAKYSIAYNPTSNEVAGSAKIVIQSETLYPVIKVVKAILKIEEPR